MDLSSVTSLQKLRCDTQPISSPPSPDIHILIIKVGGPLALIRDGDKMIIDAKVLRIDVDVSSEELERRRKEWKAPPLKASRGTLYKYIKNVASASLGCVTDE